MTIRALLILSDLLLSMTHTLRMHPCCHKWQYFFCDIKGQESYDLAHMWVTHRKQQGNEQHKQKLMEGENSLVVTEGEEDEAEVVGAQ